MTTISIKRTPEGWVLRNDQGQVHVRPYPTKRLAENARTKILDGLIHFQANRGQAIVFHWKP